MRSPRSLDALRVAYTLSDRQRGYHVCGDINVSHFKSGYTKCWCKVEGGKTQFPHSHGETGSICREPLCEWHTQLSQEEVTLGQVGNWN
jgi:hypothetical protein